MVEFDLISVNKAINSFVWGPVMLALLVGTGIYLSIRVGFIQFSRAGYWWKNTIGRIFKKSEAGEGEITPMQALSDGALLEGLNLTVYYHASYQEFKNMVHALATDERITSIRYATFNYDSEKKLLDGQMSLTLYLMPSAQNTYEEPGVTPPATGKTDIFN